MVNWPLISSIILPNVGGWVSSVTMAGQVKKPDGSAWYQKIKKPRWNPPSWVFGPVWTALYCGMGYSSYLVYEECGGFTNEAILPLALYGGHLILNWTWTPVFFRFHLIGLGFLHMCALDALAIATTTSFAIIKRHTLIFMVPYLAWLSFATFLNYTIWRLNPDSKDDKE